MNQRLISLLSIAALLVPPLTLAEDKLPTLEKIKQSGQFTLGVRESSPPFSFVESGRPPAKGYSIDISMRIAEAIAKDLKIPKLETKQIIVTPANRIPKLVDGAIDLECGSTTNTETRLREVAFSYTTFMTGTRFLVKKSSHFVTAQDLKGKVVISTTGTNNEKIVTKYAYDQTLGFIMKSGKDHAEGFAQVKAGTADAFAMDDVLLAGLIAQSGKPDDYEIIGTYVSIDPYGLMTRKNDPQFLNFVDNVLIGLFHSGEITKIYNKWFLTKDLNFSMPRLLKESIVSPSKEPAWPR